MENVLVLVRHGESEWNKLNLFTGWRDPDLTETGIEEAHRAGVLLKKEAYVFDIAFTSALKRAQHTLDIILDELGQKGLEIVENQALNERDYGDLCGLNKDDARKKLGRGAGSYLAPVLRCSSSWRREPEGYRRARPPLLREHDPAAGSRREKRARLGAWQFVESAHHAARQTVHRRDPEAQPADRRALCLSPERRWLRRVQSDAVGIVMWWGA